MATKKKTSKNSAKSKKIVRKRATPKSGQRPKKLAKKKVSPKPPRKKKIAAKKIAARKIAGEKLGKKSGPLSAARSNRADSGPPSGELSGDLQGLSRREIADSESVDELIEEGNAFEAGVVAGVQSADDADEKEVRTHEVPEDDVPGEYLDQD
jgi:hypothetical protein